MHLPFPVVDASSDLIFFLSSFNQVPQTSKLLPVLKSTIIRLHLNGVFVSHIMMKGMFQLFSFEKKVEH